jgi:predicted permease
MEAAQSARAPKTRLTQKVKQLMAAVLVPPVIAVFSGFFIGIIPALRSLLVDTRDFDNDRPLEFIFNAVVAFGKAAVPMNMMVLGASLASMPNFASIEWPVTLAVTACKLVLHPAMGFAVVYGLDSMGFIAAITGNQRPSFIVVACLMCATPTANNVQVMAEVSGGAECKRALSAMIFVMYCLAPFVLTFWIVVAISMAQSA